MKIGVLGTGMVGRSLSGKLSEVGHSVVVGTRDVTELLARTESTMGGRVGPFAEWHRENPDVKVDTFAGAAAHGEVVFNATAGAAALEVLRAAGESNLEDKVLVDVSNPIDSSGGGGLPTLFVSNTDSLAEQIQREFPRAKVVKTLNTMNASVMVDPQKLGGGDHHVFVGGDDASAKEKVIELLREGFGWQHIIDLGDITTARGTEMFLSLWLRLMQARGTAAFNVKIVG